MDPPNLNSVDVIAEVAQGESSSEQLLERLKHTYDWLKSVERRDAKALSAALSELLVSGFDQEQIWQQIDLQSRDRLRKLQRTTRQFAEHTPDILNVSLLGTTDEPEVPSGDDGEVEEEEDEEERDEEASSDHQDEQEFGSEDEEEEEADMDVLKKQNRQKTSSSSVEDKFFRLAQMEEFLEEEDRKEFRRTKNDEDEDMDNFDWTRDDDDDSVSAASYRYDDFFDPVPTYEEDNDGRNMEEETQPEGTSSNAIALGQDRRVRWKDDDGQEEDNLAATSLEVRQRNLKRHMAEMEEQNLKPKSWQMSGEVVAETRPENSLLQEHLKFDHATRLPPVVTQDTTEKMEELIKQRIRDRAWDDVERKEKPKTDPKQYRNELILEQEKPKMSLAQVYEQEFLKKTQKETEEKTNPKHEEIKKMMKDLFVKLDALSNYHYAPKQPTPEVRVVNNMRSLNMEEVAPVTVSDAALLAPEEVKNPTEPRAEEEKDATDRNRARRKTKDIKRRKAELKRLKESKSAVPKDTMQALRKVGRIKKAKPGKNAADGSLASSAKFFSQLQTQVSTDIASKKNASLGTLTSKSKRVSATYKL